MLLRSQCLPPREVLLGYNSTSNPYPGSVSSQRTSPLGTVTPCLYHHLCPSSGIRAPEGEVAFFLTASSSAPRIAPPRRLKKELLDCLLAYFAVSLSPPFHTVLSAWAWQLYFPDSLESWLPSLHPIRPKGRKKVKEGSRGPAGAPPAAVQAPVSPHTHSARALCPT